MTLLTTYHMTHSARKVSERIHYRVLDAHTKQRVIKLRAEHWFCNNCNIDFFREYRIGHMSEVVGGRDMVVSTPDVMIGEMDY